MRFILTGFFVLSLVWSAACMPAMPLDGGEEPVANTMASIVRGKVTQPDGEPVAYVNIGVMNTTQGTVTDSKGEYHLSLPEGSYTIVYSSLGYETQQVEVSLKTRVTKVINITLVPAATDLGEFEVVADKRDRAKEIMKIVRDKRPEYLGRVQAYQCEAYLKNALEQQRLDKPSSDTIPLDDLEIITTDSTVDTVFKRQFTDIVERNSTLYFERPGKFKETVHAYDDHKKRSKNPSFGRNASVEVDYDLLPSGDIVDYAQQAENAYILFPDHQSANINFYKNLLELPKVSQKPITSPIAATSALNYLYDFEGFFYEEGRKVFKIKVTPIVKTEALFNGYIYIEDSTYALRSVDLEVNPNALLFSNELHINQHYKQIEDTYLPSNIKVKYTINDESKVIIYGTMTARYDAYALNPEFESRFFTNEIITYDPEAFDRDSTYWVNERPELLEATEMRFIDESDSLELYYVSDEYYRQLDSAFNRIDLWTPLIGLGHRNRVKGTEWYVEGLLGQVNLLGVGGYRHRLPVHFKKEFKNAVLFETDVTPDYGPSNGDVKVKTTVGLTYVPKKFVRTRVVFGNFYDRVNDYSSVEQLFARSNYVDALTIGIAQRMEIVNGLFAEVSYTFSDQRPIKNLRHSAYEKLIFPDSLLEPIDFERYIKSEFRVDLQYRFRQKYFIKGNKKIIVGSDWPEVFATYRKGVPGLLKSEVNFDYFELGLRDKMTLRRFGDMSWRVIGGTYLNKGNLRVLEYKYLRGSDQYFFSDPTNSMQLLGPTFSTPDPFVQANYIHHFNGTILNKVPVVNKLKLTLAAGGAALYVNESDFAQVELFAGLERVVRIQKQPFRFGLYAVTADNSISTAKYSLKFGINFFNTFTNSWLY